MSKLNSLLLIATTISACLIASPQPTLAGQDKTLPQKNQSALTLDVVSSEPDTPIDSHARTTTLHWSADGARFAWLHQVTPGLKARDKSPQNEIRTLDSISEAHSHPAPQAESRILVSIEKVTSCLRGSDQSPHQATDDDARGNPYFLQDFAWSPDHTALLLIGTTSVAWLDLASGEHSLLVSGKEASGAQNSADHALTDQPSADQALTSVSLAPNGKAVSFVRNHSLWLLPLKSGKASSPPLRFSKSPRPDVSEGELDWPYKNELHLPTAHAWSPDSSSIAWLEIDDRAVAKYTLRASDGTTRQIAYPKPGGELPLVRVLVKRITAPVDTPPLAINLGLTRGYYFPRISWLPDGQHLTIQRLNRHQQKLDLFIADARTGQSQIILTENDKYWVNLSDDLIFLKDCKRFLWTSERNNFRHLFLYDIHGKQITQLTSGAWEVTQLLAIDEATSRVYFTATEASPLERQLYSVRLDGTALTRISQQPGTHETRVSPDASSAADISSSQLSRPQVGVIALTQPAAPASVLPQTNSEMTPALQPVEFLNLRMHMGTDVRALLIKPPAFDPTRKYPVIVYLAGGPGEQLVRNTWGGATALWMQSMAQKGFVIFALDNQGTAARGHYFEEPVHLRLGAQEMTDLRDAVAYLTTLPYVDRARLGACGWGYGGFLVIHALLDRPVAFRAGFAGAPIVDWHFYDAIFAERYLDDPVAFADGWQASTALDNARFFQGKLMLAQGTEDEFVHIENMLTLQDHLLDNGKSADVLLLPDRGHSIDDSAARLVLFTSMTDFFIKNL